MVSDPFRRPTQLWSSAFAPIGSVADKVRIAGLRRRVRKKPSAHLLRGPDVATSDSLRASGFSPKMISRFFRPLVGGIQLDPSLSTSSRMFEVVLRSLFEGDSAVPALGMGAIPEQLAAALPLV